MQAQIQSQPAHRKRKGISLSLTPHKNNHSQINQVAQPVAPSPKSQSIHMQQSHVIFNERPLYPKYIRVFSSSCDKPSNTPITFSYSNASKQQEIKQARALDQQIYVLRKQIQDTRQTVGTLNNNTYRRQNLQTSNVAIIYSNTNNAGVHISENEKDQNRLVTPVVNGRQTRILNHSQPEIAQFNTRIQSKQLVHFKVPIEVSTPVLSNNNNTIKNPQAKQFKPVVSKEVQKVNTKKAQKNSNNFAINQVQLNTYNELQKHISQNKSPINKITCDNPLSKQHLAYENNNNKIQYKIQNSIQKQNKSVLQKPINTIPIDNTNVSNQNKIKNKQRLQRLRWAEKKLLDIIRVCDHGL